MEGVEAESRISKLTNLVKMRLGGQVGCHVVWPAEQRTGGCLSDKVCADQPAARETGWTTVCEASTGPCSRAGVIFGVAVTAMSAEPTGNKPRAVRTRLA